MSCVGHSSTGNETNQQLGSLRTRMETNDATLNGTTENQKSEPITEVRTESHSIKELKNNVTETKSSSTEKVVEDERSFLQRNAFVITLIAYSMFNGIMWAVHGQYRYQFFHDMYGKDLKQYNITRECGEALEPAVQAIENKISAETAKWTLYSNYIKTPTMVIAYVVIGLKSDQIGRRLIFLMPFVTSIANCIIMAVVIRLELHYGYFLIGVFIYSLSGGSGCMYLSSYALVSDTHGKKGQATEPSPASSSDNTTSTKEKNHQTSQQTSASDEIDLDMSREKSRTFKLLLLAVVPGLSSSIVAFVQGYIIAYLGFFWSMIIVIGLKGLVFLFAFVFITETGKQRKSIEVTGPLKTIGRAIKDPSRRVPILLTNLALLFSILASVEENEIIRTYEMSPPFCLRSIQLGWLTAEYLLQGVVAIPLMRVWQRMRLRESTIAGIGIASYMAGALLLATVRQTWVFYANYLITIPSALSTTMAKAITSRFIGRSALASTFAVMVAIEELFAFLGGIASNYLYQNTLDVLPTASFYLAACSFAVATVLYFALTVYQMRTKDTADREDTLHVQNPSKPASH